MTQPELMQNFTTASGAGEHNFAAIESVHAYDATGQTALASIITYTKPEGFPAIFRNLTDTAANCQSFADNQSFASHSRGWRR